MSMMELLKVINTNVLGGVGFALFAVLVGTRVTITGLRDYIFILTIAVLGTASVVEHWFLDNSFITSCLIGFAIGFLADDIYLNLKATMPEFIKDILHDILDGLKNRIKKFLGIE